MTQKKPPNYLGTGQTSGLLDFIKVNGYLAIPLALTDLRRRFVVTDRDGNFCAELEFSIFEATNAQIHKRVLEVIEKVRNGEIASGPPPDIIPGPPAQPQSPPAAEVTDNTTTFRDDLSRISALVTELCKLIDGLAANIKTLDDRTVSLHERLTKLEDRPLALILQPPLSLLQRLRSLFRRQKRES